MFTPESPKPIKNPAPLNRVTALTAEQINILEAHWIISIQEFLALTEMPATAGPLAKLLKIDRAALKELDAAARKQLGATRGEDESEAALMEIEYASGVLTPPAAMRAKIKYETIPREEKAPPALSYSDELPPIRNQGNTCLGTDGMGFQDCRYLRNPNPGNNAGRANGSWSYANLDGIHSRFNQAFCPFFRCHITGNHVTC